MHLRQISRDIRRWPNPEVVAKFEKAWNTKLNPNPGLHATDVFPAAIKGDVKGLYIYGEDPVVTDPDTHHIIKALEEPRILCDPGTVYD